jgi:hypothetical protein
VCQQQVFRQQQQQQQQQQHTAHMQDGPQSYMLQYIMVMWQWCVCLTMPGRPSALFLLLGGHPCSRPQAAFLL